MENKNKFLTVGPKLIAHELMCPPMACIYNDSSKSAGGLWATYDEQFLDCNMWLLYLSRHESVFYNKFSHSAVRFEINEDSNILYIDSYEELLNLQKKYPIISTYDNQKNKLIDYHSLAKKYDGIYLSFSAILSNEYLKEWSVGSLVLFNLDCIKEFQPIQIDAWENSFGRFDYFLDKEYEVQKVKPINEQYVELFEKYSKKYLESIQRQGIEQVWYEDFWEFHSLLKEMSTACYNANYNIIEQIEKVLRNEVLKGIVSSENLMRSIALQSIDKHYDYLNDVYIRNLKR